MLGTIEVEGEDNAVGLCEELAALTPDKGADPAHRRAMTTNGSGPLQERTVELAGSAWRHVEENRALPWFLHCAIPFLRPPILRSRSGAVRVEGP